MAIRQASVQIFIRRGAMHAAAHDLSATADGVLDLNAHNIGDRLRAFSITYGALPNLGTVLHDGTGISGTAAVAATAAVGTGKTIDNLINTRILTNGKDLCRNGKKSTENESDGGENQYGIQNLKPHGKILQHNQTSLKAKYEDR
jgi:hypothetical protein